VKDSNKFKVPDQLLYIFLCQTEVAVLKKKSLLHQNLTKKNKRDCLKRQPFQLEKEKGEVFLGL
jgi:hypothetical protein